MKSSVKRQFNHRVMVRHTHRFVTISVGDDTRAMLHTGATIVDPTASLYWPDWIGAGDKILAAMEGPYSVLEAWQRAEFLCALWAFDRVVISLQRRSTWRREWGELREVEGLE